MSDVAKRLILYMALALCLMGYGWVEGRAAQQTADAVNYGQAVLGGHRGFASRLKADSLTVARLTHLGAFWGDSEAYWKRVAQQAIADTVDSTAPSSPATPLVALGRALDACDAGKAAQDSALQVLQTDLALCKARGDTLETAVGRLLKVRSPRWGFTVGPAMLGQPNGSVHAGIALVWGYRF